MTNLGKLVVAGALVVIVGIGAGVYYLTHGTSAPMGVACTMEAKLCPDGSSVGRTGPNCEFAACPSASTTSNTNHPLIADIYPLYSGASWPSSVSMSMTLGSTTYNGYKIVSLPSATTTNIASVANAFISYYDKKLVAAGWKQDTSLDADGAGSSSRVYKSGAGVLVLGYNTDFIGTKANAPVECPCKVSLSIFSSTAGQ